jgi:hypothetical protein
LAEEKEKEKAKIEELSKKLVTTNEQRPTDEQKSKKAK